MDDRGSDPTGTILFKLLANVDDQLAWSRFVELYGPMVRRWARTELRKPGGDPDVEDVFSRVLFNLIRLLPTFEYDPAKSFRAWLRAVVHNQIRTAWREWAARGDRRGSGDTAVLERLHEEPDPATLEGWAAEFSDVLHLRHQAVTRALEAVKDPKRPELYRAFELMFFQDRTAAEVAAELGMKESAVYVNKHRILKRIKAILAENGPT